MLQHSLGFGVRFRGYSTLPRLLARNGKESATTLFRVLGSGSWEISSRVNDGDNWGFYVASHGG